MSGALLSAITRSVPSLTGKVFDYSDAKDFGFLWDHVEQSSPRLPVRSFLGNEIVIVWGNVVQDQALSPINTSACLSPLDWAAAYAKRLGDDPVKWPRILVLDLVMVGRTTMPAITFYQGLNPSHLGWITYQKMRGLGAILDWLGQNGVSDELASAYPVARDRMLREARRNLTEGGDKAASDRHAVANIIAPMILRRGLPPPPKIINREYIESIHAPALKALLHAVGLIKEAQPISSSLRDVNGPPRLAAAMESLNGLHLMLLDDQAQHGWVSWLGETLEDGYSSAWDTNPALLVGSLQKQLAAASAQTDLRFKFVPRLAHGEPIVYGHEPVLLLDLRLFAGSPIEERSFYRDSLLPIIKEYFLDKEGLAWPSFRSKDLVFQKACYALAKGILVQESQEHLEVLTWLPRVIALADMTLPVVIFSSTGRRELIQSFAPYKNIITTFEKPRSYGGDVETLRASTSRNLRLALAEAKRLLVARSVVRRILAVDKNPLDEARQKFRSCRRIDIYHDESLDPRKAKFRVNSLVLGFSTIAKAQEFETHIDQNMRFFGRGCLQKAPPGDIPPGGYDDWYLSQWLGSIKPHCFPGSGEPVPGAPQCLLATAVKGLSHPTHDETPTDLLKPNGLDNINTDLLRLLWECLIVDVVGAIAGPDTEIRIFGATRDRAVTLKAKTPGELNMVKKALERDLWAQYGIGNLRWESPKILWKSLSTDSFFTIVASCVQARENSSTVGLLAESITTARGITLSYGEGKSKDPFAMNAHYLIDVLGGLIDVHVSDQRIGFRDFTVFQTPAEWAVRGFRDELVVLSSSARHADAARWSELLCGLSKLNYANHGSLAIYLLIERFCKAVPKFSGDDFLGCVERLNVS